MKMLGILFTLLGSIMFMPAEGFSNFGADRIERWYIDSSKLHFSDEGIFLESRSGEWKPIGHIYHDSKGYYLARSNLIGKQLDAQDVWTCPSCYSENTSTSGVCSVCLWPLYEWD
jgi:hypothetical protein